LYLNFLINTENCFIESQVENYFLIFAWRWSGGPAISTAAEWVSSEKVFENVVEVEIEWVTAHSSAPKSFVTELVISGSSFVVGENCVGLADFFEFGFGLFVVGVRVRMKFSGKFAVCAFEVFRRCAAIHF
jgi:hypothetical protein